MSEDTVSRFIVRKGSVEGKWMVWDREQRGPAKLTAYTTAIELSEEHARQVRDRLERYHDGQE